MQQTSVADIWNYLRLLNFGERRLRRSSANICLEPVADSSKPYYNVIASREDETEDLDFQIIVDYYQTPEVKEIIDEVTNKSSIPVWE